MKESKRWTPIRKGEIYCSPACGGDCTHAEFLKANRDAEALIKKCGKEVGGKWEKRVFENLGWHFEVSLVGGDLTVRQSGKTYSVSSHKYGSPAQVSTRLHSTSVKKVITTQLFSVKKEADRWNNYLVENTPPKLKLNSTKGKIFKR
jgi:hypothetical protein